MFETLVYNQFILGIKIEIILKNAYYHSNV